MKIQPNKPPIPTKAELLTWATNRHTALNHELNVMLASGEWGRAASDHLIQRVDKCDQEEKAFAGLVRFLEAI